MSRIKIRIMSNPYNGLLEHSLKLGSFTRGQYLPPLRGSRSFNESSVERCWVASNRLPSCKKRKPRSFRREAFRIRNVIEDVRFVVIHFE